MTSNSQPEGQDPDGHIVRNTLADLWEDFKLNPILFIARRAFAACIPQEPSRVDDQQDVNDDHARIVCISDTHNLHHNLPTLPPGDILIHAGDLTNEGTEGEIHSALAWLDAAPHKHKIVIAGNHDTALAVSKRDQEDILARYPTLIYLNSSSTVLSIRGRLLSVYGCPQTPGRSGTLPPSSFRYARSEDVWKEAIPHHTDVLVTHGPPAFHLDSRRLGCRSLLNALWRVRPRLHVFGHIHHGRGVRRLRWCETQWRYERACWGRGALFNTLWLVGAAVGTRMRGRPRFRSGRDTILVNASSSFGGKAREAIVIDIPLPERH